MTTRISRLLGTIVLAAGMAGLAGGAGAGTVTGFTSAWFFGDSLSDPGNLYRESGNTFPASPPYFEGRFSNGPVWAETVAGAFTDRKLATGNYAFGNATAVPDADGIPDLPDQVAAFAATGLPAAGARPAAAIWAGANDIFKALPLGTAPEAGRAAAKAVGANARALAGLGVRDVTLFNLPDFAQLPAFALFQPALAPAAGEGSAAFNAKLDRIVPKLAAKGLHVSVIDVEGLFADLLANPQDYGVLTATIPCLFPAAAGGSVCSETEALERAFFDGVHPNSVIHGRVADIALEQIAPVPLPGAAWLMLAGLGGLALVARRRREGRDPA